MSKPIKTFRLGSVQGAVFANDNDQGTFHTVTLQRRYKDENGEWKSSSSFTHLQLPYLIAVAQEAVHFLASQSDRGEDE
jgi:hypothetical protein